MGSGSGFITFLNERSRMGAVVGLGLFLLRYEVDKRLVKKRLACRASG